MKNRKNTRKRVAAVATGAALTFIVGGVAFAYWTTSGSGTGSAATGNTNPITISSTAVTGLYPGGAPVAVAGSFTNPNPGPVFVDQVTVKVSPTWTAGTTNPCTAADFAVTQPTQTGRDIVTGDTWTGATIQLKNLATNQDNCKGVTVPLVLTSN
jgi:hypothetical protein